MSTEEDLVVCWIVRENILPYITKMDDLYALSQSTPLLKVLAQMCALALSTNCFYT